MPSVSALLGISSGGDEFGGVLARPMAAPLAAKRIQGSVVDFTRLSAVTLCTEREEYSPKPQGVGLMRATLAADSTEDQIFPLRLSCEILD